MIRTLLFLISIAFIFFSCGSKHHVNFVLHDCEDINAKEVFKNVRLFKASSTASYGDGKFITFLSAGNNNLTLEEGSYYVVCFKQVINPNWKNEGECFKFFDVTGVISEYDLCKTYNRGNWSPIFKF